MEAEGKIEKLVMSIIRKKMEADAESKTKSNREAVRTHVFERMAESMRTGAEGKGIELDDRMKDEMDAKIRAVLDKVIPTTKSKPAVPSGAKEVAGKEYVESEDVKAVADKIIKDKAVDVSGVSIRYIEVHPKISTYVAAKCIKAGPLVKYFGDCDIVVQVSGDYWAALSDRAREILVYHELKHINKDNSKAKMKLTINDHNVKDFRCIIDEYGIDWVDEVYDGILNTFDEEQREKVKTEKIKW